MAITYLDFVQTGHMRCFLTSTDFVDIKNLWCKSGRVELIYIFHKIVEFSHYNEYGVSSLTLRLVAYYDEHLGEVVDFNMRGGRDQYFEVLRKWPEGRTAEEKQESLMNSIIWEPCDGQHIVHVCKVLAEEICACGNITEEKMKIIFRERFAIPMVYNNPRLYIEMSEQQNDFHTPNRKATHGVAWQTLIKIQNLWNAYE